MRIPPSEGGNVRFPPHGVLLVSSVGRRALRGHRGGESRPDARTQTTGKRRVEMNNRGLKNPSGTQQSTLEPLAR